MIELYAPLPSVFLIQGLTYYLCFLLSFICSWLSNKPPHELLTIPSVCCSLCPPFFKNNRAFYMKFDF